MEVVLHVYDLPEQERINDTIPIGFYHSGVMIGEVEYSFSSGGIQRTRPLLAVFGRFRERIHIGTYREESTDLARHIQALSSEGFSRGMYNVIHNNCNDFSEALCQALLQKSIPDWVNRAARLGRNFVSASSMKKIEQQQQDTFAMPGQVADPTLTDAKAVTGNNEAVDASCTSLMNKIFGWISPTTPPSCSIERSQPTSTTFATTKKVPNVASSEKRSLNEKQKAVLAKIKANQS